MRNADDTKVLELQFENKDFEKNAAQSISTIEKLKESLDFTDSTKGLEDINSNIKAVNFSNLTNGIREATNGFNMLEVVAFGVFNRLGGRIADFAVDTLGKLFFYVPNKIMQGGFTRATNVDQAEFLLKGMGKDIDAIHDEIEIADKYIRQSDEDAKKAGKSIKTLSADINSAVSQTSFGYDQAAKAAAQLAASNVEVGNEMRSALQGISGVATMTNSSYDEIAYVFTKVAASGKAMNGELRMLSDRGLPVTASIAKYMNDVLDGTANVSEDVAAEIKEIANGIEVTEADVVEFASKSKISWRIFKDAMFDAYSAQAFEANKTYEGLVTNIGAQLARIGEIFAGPFRDDALPVLEKVYEIIKKTRDIVNNSLFAAGVIAAMKKISDALVFVLGKVDDFLGKVRDVQEKLDLVSKVKGLFGWGKAAEEAEDAADKMTGSFEEVRDTALKVIKGDWGNGMARMQALTEAGFDAQTIQDYVNALWEVTGHDWSKVFDEEIQKQAWAMLDLGEATEATGEKTANLTKMTNDEKRAFREAVHELPKEEKLLLSVANAFTGVSNTFDQVKQTFSEKFKMPENVDVLDVVANKVYDVSDSFATFTTEHGEDIATVFGGIYDAALLVVDGFRFVGRAVWSGLNTAFSALGVTVWDVIVYISGLITNIRNWVTENKILELAIEAINGAIRSVIGGMKGLYESFMKIPAVQKTMDKFNTAFTDVFTKTPYYLNKTSTAVKQFSTKAKRAFKDLRDKKISPAEFFDEIKSAWKGFTYTIGNFEFIKNMREGFIAAKDGVKEWVKELGNNEDGTRNTFGKITDTATSALDWVTEKIKTAWSGISNFFKEHGIADFFGDNFVMFRGALKRFFDSLPGFASGLKGKWGEFMQKVTDMGGFKFENIGQIWQAFQDTIGQYWKDQDIFAPIKSAFELMKNSAKDKLKEVGIDVDAIIAYVQDIPNKIKNFFTNGETGEVDVGYGINKIIESLKTAFSTGKEDVETEGNSLIDKIKEIPGKIANIFTTDEGHLASIPQIIANIFDAIAGAFSDGGDGVETTGNTLVETIKAIPGKIVAIFTTDEGNLASIPEIINNIFTAILEVFTGTTAEANEVTPDLVTSITDAPAQVKTFFEGWSIPDAFNTFIGMFTSVDEVAGDEDKKSNMMDLGGKFKEFGARIKDGLNNIPWDKITHILGLIGAFAFLGGAVSIVKNVRKVVDSLTDTFGQKAKARSLTAGAVLKIALAIGVVSYCVKLIADLGNDYSIGEIWNAVGVVATIGAVLTAMDVVSTKFGSGSGAGAGKTNFTGFWTSLGQLFRGGAIWIVADAMKKIQDAGIDEDTKAYVIILMGCIEAMNIGDAMFGVDGLSEFLTGLGNALTGGALWLIADAMAKMSEAGVTEDTVKQVGWVMAGLEAMTVINGFLGPLKAIGGFLGGGVMVTMAGSVALIAHALAEMNTMDAEESAAAATKFCDALEDLTTKLKEIKLDSETKKMLTDLVDVIGLVNNLGTGTIWQNILTALPQITFDDPLGTNAKSAAQLAGEAAEQVAQMVAAWNTGLGDEELNADQLDAVQKLVDVLSSATWTGFNEVVSSDLSGFETNATHLGTGITNFNNALEEFDPEITTKAITLLDDLALFADKLRELQTGEYTTIGEDTIYGEGSSLASFGGAIGIFAQKIQDYIKAVSTFEGFEEAAENTSKLANGIDIITNLNFTEGDIANEGSVTTFTDHLKKIAAGLLEAASTAWFTSTGVEKLKDSVDTVNSMNIDGSAAGEAAAESAAESMSQSTAVNDAAKTVMSNAFSAMSDSAKSFNSAGFDAMNNVASGIRQGGKVVKEAAAAVADRGKDAIKEKRADYKTAGSYVTHGFSSGISSVRSEVVSAAHRIAKAAVDEIKATIESASPSKVTRRLGKYFGQGFVIGIDDYSKSAGAAGKGIATEARNGLEKAIGTINKLVTNDLDATPVIRPVLDLSEIQNGANSIGSMLDTNPSLALAGNLGAINASITNRTDPNAGIIAALDSLRDNLKPGDTYNIDGVTYDDGSNIADAVGTLVRAARMERRV